MSKLLVNAPLFYPSARDWMWDYCIYLGPFTDSEGKNFDLGVFLGEGRIAAAVVHGNTPGDYYSGELDDFGYNDNSVHSEIYKETRKRAEALNLYKPKANN